MPKPFDIDALDDVNRADEGDRDGRLGKSTRAIYPSIPNDPEDLRGRLPGYDREVEIINLPFGYKRKNIESIEAKYYSDIQIDATAISSAMHDIYFAFGIDSKVSERISESILQIIHDEVAAQEAGASRSTTAHSLPNKAPVKWKDREPGETAPEFARRVYGPYGLAEGIPKRALRALDAALVNELNSWTRSGNLMPPDVKLLTKGEENDRLLNAGGAAIKEHLGKFTGAEAVREAQRLNNARYRKR